MLILLPVTTVVLFGTTRISLETRHDYNINHKCMSIQVFINLLIRCKLLRCCITVMVTTSHHIIFCKIFPLRRMKRDGFLSPYTPVTLEC